MKEMNGTRRFGYALSSAAIAALALAPGLAVAEPATDNASADDGDAAKEQSRVVNKTGNATSKEETVYEFTDASGNHKSTEVASALRNVNVLAGLKDSSILTGIKNVEGHEGFDVDGTSLTWDAQGNDIYYKGDTDKKIPVTMAVSYELDGQSISPDELKGKSGHVKIRYSYTNNSTVKVDGYTMHTPFVCITGMLLDNGKFKNVEVTNGKATDNGDRTIVAGYALPGMQSNFNVSKSTVDIPDYFEVSADVTEFEMESTLTIITPNALESVDTDEFGMTDIDGSLSQLQDGMDQLMEGSDELSLGLQKLVNGAGSLDSGLAQLKSKTASLPSSTFKLDSGMGDLLDGLSAAKSGSSALNAGSGSVYNGLKQLKYGTKNSGGLVDAQKGEREIIAGLTKAINGLGDQGVSYAIKSVSEGTDELIKSINGKLKPGLEQAKNAADSAASEARQASDDAGSLSSSISSASSKLDAIDQTDMSQDQIDKIEAAKTALSDLQNEVDGVKDHADNAKNLAGGASGGISSIMGDDGLGKVTSALNAEKDGLEKAQAGISQVIDGLGAAKSGSQSIYEGLQKANEALGSDDSKNTLINGAKQLRDGSSNLTSGLAEAIAGAKQIKQGTSTLSSSSSTLVDGVSQLKDGSGQLVSGEQQAADGAKQLSNGLSTFNKQGISKIVDSLDDVSGFADRLDAIVEAGKQYDNFSGIAEGTDGSVKFIIETDAIN